MFCLLSFSIVHRPLLLPLFLTIAGYTLTPTIAGANIITWRFSSITRPVACLPPRWKR